MATRSFQHFLVSFLVVLVLCAKPGLGTTGAWRGRDKLSFTSNMALSMIMTFFLFGEMNKTRDCCRWRGVHCGKQSGHIVKLHLPAPPIEFDGVYQSLRGEISP